MSLTITQNEQAYLMAVLRQMDDVPAVDYQKVADEVGTKYAKNARAAVKKIWDKLKQGATTEDQAAEGEEEAPKKKKGSKAAAIAKITKPAARQNANAGGKRGKKLTKKEQEALEAQLANEEDEEATGKPGSDSKDATIADSVDGEDEYEGSTTPI